MAHTHGHCPAQTAGHTAQSEASMRWLASAVQLLLSALWWAPLFELLGCPARFPQQLYGGRTAACPLLVAQLSGPARHSQLKFTDSQQARILAHPTDRSYMMTSIMALAVPAALQYCMCCCVREVCGWCNLMLTILLVSHHLWIAWWLYWLLCS